MKTLIIAALLIGAASCAQHRVKVLDASAVSMTHTSVEANQNLVEIGDVEGEFCADSMNDKGSIGLIDMAVENAQKKTGADWITNASFWRSGNCMVVTGTGKKLTAAAATPAKATKKTR